MWWFWGFGVVVLGVRYGGGYGWFGGVGSAWMLGELGSARKEVGVL